MSPRPSAARSSEAGNIIFFILLAIVLIAVVTAAIRSGSDGSGDVDRESVTLDASKIKQYASELERGTVFILSGGASENDIRFAATNAATEYGTDITVTPQFQLFSPQGGGVEYTAPPTGANDGSPWEFYGNTALPLVGSDKPELIAVLPKITQALCARINQMDGFPTSPQPAMAGTCINAGGAARFGNSIQYSDSGPVNANASTFPSSKPMLDGCVSCSDGSFNYYHVLHAR